MPELPEVETTRRGIAPHLLGQRIQGVTVRQPRLRWDVPAELAELLPGQRVVAVERRAKYLLIELERGTLILHLGMSGSLRVLPADATPGPHDHFDLRLDGRLLRLRDPRRFGAVLWTENPPLEHPLLRDLGPEPLGEGFDGDWLHRQAGSRRGAVKAMIMDGHVVVGVGNIYASESLFMAGIHPHRAANRIGLARYRRLADSIREVLSESIRAGGTTLRDFVQEDGSPGYFAQQLRVYDRAGESCGRCGATVKRTVTGQRATYYCARCQR